jgi:type I site-specific restriction-modification system R (restriction) subunit
MKVLARLSWPASCSWNRSLGVFREVNRSQHGFSAEILSNNDNTLITHRYAKYLRDALPKASLIEFTGIPLEKADRCTSAFFWKIR